MVKINLGIPSECKTVQIQIKAISVSGLNLVQTVFKGYKQTTLKELTCADPESFVRGGPTLTCIFFKLMKGGSIQISL